MINEEPSAFFHLKAQARKKGGKGWTSKRALDDRRWRIGYFVERRIRETGRYKQSVWEVGQHFSVEKTKVGEDLNFVRKYVERTTKQGFDGWALLNEQYAADYPW